MKRFFAALLALAMIFSLGITVFADDPAFNGSITITNATEGESYALYKIFDASVRYVKDEDGEIVMENDEPKVESISYNIDPKIYNPETSEYVDNPYFTYLFQNDKIVRPEENKNDKYYNPYFDYAPNSTIGNVFVKTGAKQEDIVAFLTKMVDEAGVDPVAEEPDFQYNDADNIKNSERDDLEFKNLEPGYYLVTSSLNTTVTLNTNTPNVRIIDKNQRPGTNLDKAIYIGKDPETGKEIWENENSAGYGDSIQYRITLDTANYDGDKKILYYQIYDEKGDGLWVEFTSIRVSVGGVELPRGYYLAMGGDNTDNWKLLGNPNHTDGWNSDKYKNETDEDILRKNAQWFLVHEGYDKFRITIPWVEDHTLTEGENAENKKVYKLNFKDDAESIYPSSSKIEVTFEAAVEGSASIGGTTHGNRFNKAWGAWTCENDSTSTEPDEVSTKVYGLGILKDDLNSKKNLADADFIVYRTYKNGEYKDPVNVIPTGIEGVYAVDSLDTALDDYSGAKRETTRSYYEYLRYDDGAYILDANDQQILNTALKKQGTATNTVMTTPANGKIVLLGLEAGTYYVVEANPPEGYNALTGHVAMNVGTGSSYFYVFADKNGNVADIQAEDTTHKEFKYDVTNTVIHNSKGSVLPTTGGAGTTMLITFGTMLAIGFAVLLITHKKMSAYVD